MPRKKSPSPQNDISLTKDLQDNAKRTAYRSLSEISLSNPKSLTLGHWWVHTPSSTYYQLRRLPLTMDKMNDKQSGIVLWHRDRKIAIHLPVEIPSDFQYLGPGHNAPSTPQSSRTT